MNVTAVARHAVEFNTRKFEAAHGKQPRGVGHWGFCAYAHYAANDNLEHVFWYAGSYTDAKKSARAFFATQPNANEVVVCP